MIPTLAASPEIVPPTVTATPIPTKTPNPLPTETAFIPQETLKIAVHVPLSGGGSGNGEETLRAAQLAVQQLTGPLRDLGIEIEVVSFDDQSSVETGRANAQEIVADPDILCGIGHFNSNVMIQASEIYHFAGLAFISPATTRSTVTDRYYLEVNRLVGRDDGQGMAAAQFADSQGATRVFVVHSDNTVGRKSADYFTRKAYLLGITVVGIIPTDLEANFKGIVRHVMASTPDVVFLATSDDQAGQFIAETRAAGYTGVFIGSDNVNSPSLARLAGPALTDGGGTYYIESVAPANVYANTTQFSLDFESTFGFPPNLYAAQAYDATGICLQGIEAAAKAIGGEIPNRKQVAQAVRAIQDYPGVAGQYRFDNKGDIVPAPYFVYKVASSDPDAWNHNALVATLYIDPP